MVGKLEVFKTEKKGFGLRTLEDIPAGAFVIEYCGEIVDYEEFKTRLQDYSDNVWMSDVVVRWLTLGFLERAAFLLHDHRSGGVD